jgi:hypothetical protein
MLVEELLEQLHSLPLTAYVVVLDGSIRGVSIAHVTYDSGEVVIVLDGDHDHDDDDEFADMERAINEPMP